MIGENIADVIANVLIQADRVRVQPLGGLCRRAGVYSEDLQRQEQNVPRLCRQPTVLC